jgi:prepilin-type processing-associated H-X9-DG protein
MSHSHDKLIGPSPPLGYAGPMSAPARRRRRRTLIGRWVAAAVATLIVGAMVIAAMLPSTSASPTQAKRIHCAWRLRTLGVALNAYVATHGRSPDSLGQLYLAGGIAPSDFLCPACADTAARGSTPDAVAADLTAGGHLSYAYVGAGLTAAAHPDTVVMFDQPMNHDVDRRDGGNVLFADGHLEWYNRAEFRTVVDRAAAGERPLLPRYLRATTQPTTQPGPRAP